MRVAVGPTNLDSGDLRVAFLSRKLARLLGVSGGSRLKVTVGSRELSLWVAITEDDNLSLLLPRNLYEELGSPREVDVELYTGTPSVEYLRKKLTGSKLSYGELRTIIRDVVSGLLSEAEIAAFIVAQTVIGMDIDEIVSLTRAMVETGSTIDFGEDAYDIHSVGGVPGNSKVSIVAVPIVASAGVFIPKTSSRAITSPAGTADTMEVLAPVAFTPEELKELARKVRGFIVWGGALNLAPADDILIRVEHRLKLDPTPQMVASIFSKKLSMRIKKLVIDVPVGSGAKVESLESGRRLAELFIRVAGELGISTRCALSYGDQPVGYAVGPALEAREALETLLGRGPTSVKEKAASLAGMVLELAGLAPQGGGRSLALRILESGKAYEYFRRIIEAMGGNPSVKPEDVEVGRYKAEIRAHTDGYITGVSNKTVAQIATTAGAPTDRGAGVLLRVKKGHKVRAGDVLLEIYSSSETRLEEALRVAETLRPITIEGMVLEVYP
jgi:AMP phosphorylase